MSPPAIELPHRRSVENWPRFDAPTRSSALRRDAARPHRTKRPRHPMPSLSAFALSPRPAVAREMRAQQFLLHARRNHDFAEERHRPHHAPGRGPDSKPAARIAAETRGQGPPGAAPEPPRRPQWHARRQTILSDEHALHTERQRGRPRALSCDKSPAKPGRTYRGSNSSACASALFAVRSPSIRASSLTRAFRLAWMGTIETTARSFD